jgi:hypothetical protein
MWLANRYSRFCWLAGFAAFLGVGRSYGVEPPAAEDPEWILQQISNKVADHLSHLPNYTCHEVINRLVSPLRGGGLRQHDRVELEVAFIGQEELFARAGDTNIQESSVTKLVPTGAMGNGLFGTHAESIFLTGAATFDYVGIAQKGGRKTYRYDFRVPVEKSNFSVGHNGAEAIVAYRGSVWADFQTFDLIGLEVAADQFPPYLRLSSVRERSEYTPVRIRGSEFLLPLHAEMEIVDSSGNLSMNEVTLEQCREYTGESTVMFEGPVDRTSDNRKTADK